MATSFLGRPEDLIKSKLNNSNVIINNINNIYKDHYQIMKKRFENIYQTMMTTQKVNEYNVARDQELEEINQRFMLA